MKKDFRKCSDCGIVEHKDKMRTRYGYFSKKAFNVCEKCNKERIDFQCK